MERPIYRLLHLVFALGLAHALFLLAQEGVRAQKLAQERARLEAELEKKRAAIARLEARRAGTLSLKPASRPIPLLGVLLAWG